MAKLVLLSAGLAGRIHELKVDKTTVGRVEDNVFQIAEPSVSSHHCEILLQGNDVIVRDLNSTNGTFINGEKVTESPLKPGQTLRLGQIEMQLVTDATAGAVAAAAAAAPAPAPAPAPASAKRTADQTLVMQRGVSLNDLESGARGGVLDPKTAGFSKKENNVNMIFWVVAGVIGLVIIGLLIYVFAIIGK